MAKNYYDILGVSRDADEKALKSAYRRLAKKYHPDINPGDKAADRRFKELSQAYDVLKDTKKRAAYDRVGHAAFEAAAANGAQGGFGHGGPGFGPDFANSMSDIFEDLFGEFMGGSRRGSQSRQGMGERGHDLRYNMQIGLKDAFSGKTAQIRVPASVTCKVCSGTGARPGTKPVTCAKCHGSGRIRATQGFFTVERTCPSCNGSGQVIAHPCEACGGSGRITQDRTLSVNIPPGVEDGTRIRLAGKGEAGERGGAGDLYIFLSVKPHELFQREGADLFCRVPVSLTTATLGGDIEVPTLDGKRTRIKVPAGTQTGKQFRLRGKGMPVLRSKHNGDLYIQVAVETPVNLNRRQAELLREFERESSKRNHPESEGFFSKARVFWNSFSE